MEPQDKLKSLIDKSRIDTNTESNDRILGDALELMARRRQPRSSGQLARFAIAAAVLIAVGFFAARLTAPAPIDVEQLRASIEQSLEETVDSRVHSHLDAQLASRWQPFEDRFSEKIHGDLEALATQTIATTDQRMMELIELIEQARLKDRIRIENALQQIEENWYRDKRQLATGIHNLTAATNTLYDYKPEPIRTKSLFDAKRNHQ